MLKDFNWKYAKRENNKRRVMGRIIIGIRKDIKEKC